MELADGLPGGCVQYFVRDLTLCIAGPAPYPLQVTHMPPELLSKGILSASAGGPVRRCARLCVPSCTHPRVCMHLLAHPRQASTPHNTISASAPARPASPSRLSSTPYELNSMPF